MVSVVAGRRTVTPRMSAWNWHSTSIALAPPSTRSSAIGWPVAATMASTTSAVCHAIDSTTARTTCARVDPRVRPNIAPRAYGSKWGEPRPVNAGTNTTPSGSATLAAIGPASDAASMRPSPSRSHCTAAPVTKIDPSIAYVTVSPSCHATEVSRPSTGARVRVAQVDEDERPGAVGVLGHPRGEAGLAEQRGLLVAGDPGDGHAQARGARRIGDPEAPAARRDARGDTSAGCRTARAARRTRRRRRGRTAWCGWRSTARWRGRR